MTSCVESKPVELIHMSRMPADMAWGGSGEILMKGPEVSNMQSNDQMYS